MRIEQLNERGQLRWAGADSRELRFSYENHFYGRCNLRVEVEYGPQNQPRLAGGTLTIEQLQPTQRGEALLKEAALRFLRQAMLRQPALFQRPENGDAEPEGSWWQRLMRRWREREDGVPLS